MAEKQRLSDDDWSAVANFIKTEKERRAQHPKRKELERVWKEIDRQISMTPLAVKLPPGSKGTDWYPQLEIPWQFDALEVIAADARRLKFPRGTSWYETKAEMCDSYNQAWLDRRETRPMLGDIPIPMKLDQETADTLVHAVLDHYHRMYDFKGAMDLLDAEAIKYGTYVARVKEVRLAKFSYDFRGESSETVKGPALVPTSSEEPAQPRA